MQCHAWCTYLMNTHLLNIKTTAFINCIRKQYRMRWPLSKYVNFVFFNNNNNFFVSFVFQPFRRKSFSSAALHECNSISINFNRLQISYSFVASIVIDDDIDSSEMQNYKTKNAHIFNCIRNWSMLGQVVRPLTGGYFI